MLNILTPQKRKSPFIMILIARIGCFFDKTLLSLEVNIGKPLLYVKKILLQNIVLQMSVIVIE